MRSLYFYRENGVVIAIMAIHVDDILWASISESDDPVRWMLNMFEIKEAKTRSVRYCGREYFQYDDKSINITCKSNIECIAPINFTIKDREKADLATESEISQLRSVLGSAGWIARQCRMEFAYKYSELQSVVTNARVQDLIDANELVSQLQRHRR